MIEKVSRLVNKDYVYEEGFVSFLLSQMSRELADRVVEKIINDGDAICIYKGVEELEYPNTEQVEIRSGIDIRPLVRCKDCIYWGKVMSDCCYYTGFMTEPDFFCAYGENNDIETQGDVTQ